MFRKSWFVITAFCALSLGTAAEARASGDATPPGIKVEKMGSMSMLVDAKGMTLYVFDGDAAGKSNCNGTCAQNWPPLTAPEGAKPVGKYTVVTREDGSTQWAVNGKPLYHWKNDKQPGDMTGDGVNGKWHAAAP